MKQTQIPIRNIYLMLCYAWEMFPETEDFEFASEKFEDSGEFFAQVLSSSFAYLKKRGLLREYCELNEEGRNLRGKVDFGATIKRVLGQNGMVSCTYDTLSIDSRTNQILKWAFRTLYRSVELRKDSRDLIYDGLMALQGVSDVEVTRRDFRGIRFHSGNKLYRFPIALCELLFELCIPDDSSSGRYKIPSLFRDENLMARLFEGFVRNFYKKEHSQFPIVASQSMDWDADGDESALAFLPRMKTDITLESPKKVAIIDTKFYSNMFDERYGAEKIKAGNLYQLMSYLRTKARQSPLPISGVLLYPENGRSAQIELVIEGYPVLVSSVDLAQPWSNVKARLLDILDIDGGRRKAA